MQTVEFEEMEREDYGDFKEPTYIIEEQENYYRLIISRGEKPTAGYDIRVKSITQQGKNVYINLELFDPEPEEFVNQIITYPQITVRIEKVKLTAKKDLLFIFKDSEGNILARR